MLILHDQINAALESTSAQMKMHVGKHVAGQMENQALTAQNSDGDNVEIQVKLVQVDKKVDEVKED